MSKLPIRIQDSLIKFLGSLADSSIMTQYTNVIFTSQVWNNDRYELYTYAWGWCEVTQQPIKLGECSEHFKPNATPETLAKYEAYKKALEDKFRKEREERDARIEAKKVRQGKDLIVVKGRKVPIGTIGRCFWIGSNQWGESVGIETASGERYFTALHNVEVKQ